MKKPINKNNGIEHRGLAVNVTIQEERLLKNLVEQLSNRYYDSSYNLAKVPIGWNTIETSSIESYVNGEVNISIESGNISTPFISSFLFTCCTKGRRNDYDLTWSCSLS